MNDRERSILTVTCFGHFLSHFNMLVFPSIVLPLADRLGMDLAAVLKLSFWQYLLFGLTALPWGLAADRWGARSLMLLYFCGAGLCGLAAALALNSPAHLMLALAGLGFFSGIYHPSGLGLISKGVTRVSVAMGYNGMFGNLGLAMAPLLTGIVNWLWGPSGAYWALAGLNLVGVVLMFFMKVNEPDRDEVRRVRKKGGSYNGFLILLLAMMMGGLVYRGATVIMPAYLELKGHGLYQALSGLLPGNLSPNLVATSLMSLVFLIGMIAQYIGGRAGEFFDVRRSYLLFNLAAIPPVLFMALVGNAPLIGLAIIYFFFLLGMQPLENTLVARLMPPQLHHSAYGAKFVLTFGVGALAVHLVGIIEKKWGLPLVFPALGSISALMALTIFLLILRTAPIRATD